MAKLTTKEHLSKHDREINAIRKVLAHGMKLLVKSQDEHLAFRKEMRELAASQKRTEASLQAFIDSMKRGSNGHSKRVVS